METLALWQRLSKYPAGKWAFSKGVAFTAPYFASIKPSIEELEHGRIVVSMRERRSVRNHLGSVHAIAMCNLAEVAAGLVSVASTPEGMRWIPAGMTVRYLKRAKGKLTANATIREIVVGEKTSIPVPVAVTDENGELVFEAEIAIHVSPKKS
ncbi:MAG: hotdog fold domain-containing protein [Spongiibacteraceae bacterium]